MDLTAGNRELDAEADALALDPAAVDGIFAASDALGQQYRLRSTLSDPAVPGQVRSEVARRLFEGRIPAAAVELVAGHPHRPRYDQPGGGRRTAGCAGSLRGLGSGRRGAGRGLPHRSCRRADSALQSTLTDPLIEVAARQRLVADVFGARALPATVRLVQRAVQRRSRTLVRTLDGYVEVAAQIGRQPWPGSPLPSR